MPPMDPKFWEHVGHHLVNAISQLQDNQHSIAHPFYTAVRGRSVHPQKQTTQTTEMFSRFHENQIETTTKLEDITKSIILKNWEICPKVKNVLLILRQPKCMEAHRTWQQSGWLQANLQSKMQFIPGPVLTVPYHLCFSTAQ